MSGLRDRMYELTTPDEVDEFFERFPNGAIFKAGSCHKTMQGFGYVEEALDGRQSIDMGFIRVVESRPASNYVAELTGVIHESPQFILLRDGKAVFDLDNWEITPESLEAGLEQVLGPAQGPDEGAPSPQGDVSRYQELLEGFVEGELPEEKFRFQWLTTFQQDATPRSKEEFDLLNSLFGDVDAAIDGVVVGIGGKKVRSGLKERAEKLLQMLNTAFA